MNRKIKMPPTLKSPPLQRSASLTSRHGFIHKNYGNNNSTMNNTQKLYRNNSFKVISPNIINGPMMRNAPAMHQEKVAISKLSSRPIRSGAFQRIDSKRLLNKY
mmetsp:Transcript_17372/g.17072  ORF Transcript_17372/g.17072 Transcript_17372/m.17072 type:complete len:104 (-) Transcript_17372:30-341(-)